MAEIDPGNPGDSLFFGIGGGSWNSALFASALQRKTIPTLTNTLLKGQNLTNQIDPDSPSGVGYIEAGFHEDEFSKEVSHTFRLRHYASEIKSVHEINYLRKNDIFYDPFSGESSRLYIHDQRGRISRDTYDFISEFHIAKLPHEGSAKSGIDYLFGLEGFSDTFEMNGSGFRNYNLNAGTDRNFYEKFVFNGTMTSKIIFKTGMSYKIRFNEKHALNFDALISLPSSGRYTNSSTYSVLNPGPYTPGTGLLFLPVIPYHEKVNGIFYLSNGGSFHAGYSYNATGTFRINFFAEGHYSKITTQEDFFSYPIEAMDYLSLPGFKSAAVYYYTSDAFMAKKVNYYDNISTIGLEIHYNY